MPSDKTLYAQVIKITHIYLGPAAERFITRQIQNHIHKDPAELSRQDLDILINWVRVAIAMITEDEAIVNEYVSRLQALTKKGQTVKE